jgi:cytoskeleton protein RodZ
MNPQPLDDHQDSSPVEHGEGIGRRLRAARIDRGLDLDHIAAQLHLKPSLIDALEAGRYEALPGPVFVAGYIRNYARQVGLNPEPLGAAYLSSARQTEPVRVWSQAQATRREGSGFLIRLMTVVLVAGLAYLFVQWWQNRAPTVSELAGDPVTMLDPAGPDAARHRAAPAVDHPPAPRVEHLALPGGAAPGHGAAQSPHADRATVAVNAADAPMPTTATASSPQDASTDSVPATDASSLPTPDASEATVAPEIATMDGPGPATGGGDDVVLEFRGPCWVDVRDSAKSFSLTGEMTQGDRRVLGGTPPYSLILGNASAVTVTVKGVPFDLTRVAKGNVARFKLDPAALP